MHTSLNEALVKLKLNNSNNRPNIKDILAQMQGQKQNIS